MWTMSIRCSNEPSKLGGTEMRPLQDQFYGDRSGTLTDPFGHVWTVATHKEDLTPEEMNERAAAAHGGCNRAPSMDNQTDNGNTDFLSDFGETIETAAGRLLQFPTSERGAAC